MTVPELTDIYVRIVYGYDIEDKRNIKRIVGYLKSNDYTDAQIISYLIVNGDTLDDSLWQDSLLKPNTFYYHNLLRIRPKAPIWHPEKGYEEIEPFFLEMKINFTLDDLLNYYYTNIRVPVELRDYNKDIGALKFLLNKYNKMQVEPIDFVLCLIDINKENENFTSSVLNLDKYNTQALDKINNIVANTKSKEIVWREYNE